MKSFWSKEINRVQDDLVASGIDPSLISVRRDGELDAVYVSIQGRAVPVLFPGPVARLNDIRFEDGRVKALHSLTNYAVRRLMAKKAYELMDRGGLGSVVDCVNVTVLLTVGTGETESLCLFKRSKHYVVEGGGLWGAVAGGIESPGSHPLDAGEKEMMEEVSLLPNAGSLENLIHRGIVSADSGPEIRQIGHDHFLCLGNDSTARILMVKTAQPVRLLGVVTDISADSTEQNFKSEYVMLVRSGASRQYISSRIRENPTGEHAEVRFIRFSPKAIKLDLMTNFDELSPPTSAALSLCVGRLGGASRLEECIRDIVNRRPVPVDHPFFTRVKSGRIHVDWHQARGAIWADLRSNRDLEHTYGKGE